MQGTADTAAATRCKVLVVEDDPASRNALRLLLRHTGFEGAYAATVAEATEAVSSFQPGSLILDVMLPDGSGGQVLDYIRARGLPIRVALATGAVDWRDRVDVQRLKPDAVFHKPLDFDQLLDWLNAPAD